MFFHNFYILANEFWGSLAHSSQKVGRILKEISRCLPENDLRVSPITIFCTLENVLFWLSTDLSIALIFFVALRMDFWLSINLRISAIANFYLFANIFFVCQHSIKNRKIYKVTLKSYIFLMPSNILLEEGMR